MSEYLYIDHKECQLKICSRALQIRHPDRPVASIPLHLLQHLVIACDLSISSGLLQRLGAEGITVSLINQRGKHSIDCISHEHGNYQRRLNQYALVLNPDRCLLWARHLVRHKISRQMRRLRDYVEWRPALKSKAALTYKQLNSLRLQCSEASEEQLLGLEGAASKTYFSFYARLIPKGFEFNGRNKRPPKDPVNALLSLSYSLLTSECSRALQKAGLDPAFGVFHKVAYNRPSLACDLVEVFRTDADYLVWRMLADQELRPHHFGQQLGACLLSKEGRKHFFPLYHYRMTQTYKRISRIARLLARRVTQGEMLS